MTRHASHPFWSFASAWTCAVLLLSACPSLPQSAKRDDIPAYVSDGGARCDRCTDAEIFPIEVLDASRPDRDEVDLTGPGAPSKTPVCSAGTTQSCTCASGKEGNATCLPDSSGYGPCACAVSQAWDVCAVQADCAANTTCTASAGKPGRCDPLPCYAGYGGSTEDSVACPAVPTVASGVSILCGRYPDPSGESCADCAAYCLLACDATSTCPFGMACDLEAGLCR